MSVGIIIGVIVGLIVAAVAGAYILGRMFRQI